MQVTYKDHFGGDVMVVNCARVSFAKEIEELELPKDERLIKYLADHDHWMPFAHPRIQFHFKAPIFVARQLAKHQVGFEWSEISRRYVDDNPELYNPKRWRARAENVKQGSSDSEVVDLWGAIGDDGFPLGSHYETHMSRAIALYNDMIANNVAPEQARIVLPQSMYTEWIWTGSLYAWARMCTLRHTNHNNMVQPETQFLAQAVDRIIVSNIDFFHSWRALRSWSRPLEEMIE